MKNWIISILSAIVFILIGWFANVAWNLPRNQSPIVSEIKTYPLEKYTIANLTEKYPSIEQPNVVIGKELPKSAQAIKDKAKFTSNEFTYSFDPTLTGGTKKTVSGVIDTPDGPGPFPVIVMFRGYVDQTQYFMGEGTQHAAEFFAENGFITVAPDFLGYGDSDKESSDIFESRFQTYVTAMAMIKSVPSIKSWDGKNVFIWAHSNGGQVALTSLETTGVNYPTVLWAPNSAKFPYSIIYYLDEASDQGKLVITKLAEFMADYDVTKYAFNYYLTQIKAPIELDQGTADPNVPPLWNDALSKNLKNDGVDITYIKYPGADHNLSPTWSQTILNDLKFYQDHLAK